MTTKVKNGVVLSSDRPGVSAGSNYDVNTGQVSNIMPPTPAPLVTPPEPDTPAIPSPYQGTTEQQNDLSTAKTGLKTNATQEDTALTQYQSDREKLMYGAVPLTKTQQAQIDGLTSQFQQLIENQKLQNTNSLGVANVRGYQTGVAQYDPTFQAKTIGAIFTAGQQKVANLQLELAGKIGDLTEAIRTNDLKAIKENYDEYVTRKEKVDTQLQKTIDDTQKAIKEAQDNIYNRVTKPIQEIEKVAMQNGLTDVSILSKIKGAGSVEEALAAAGDWLQTATGTLGEYLAYKRQAVAAGQQPLSYDEWQKAEDARELKKKSKEAFAVAYAQESAKSQFVGSDKNQQALEKDYKNTLLKEVSNRSGGLGLQDQKVNQALHLKALMDQYYDPPTGKYNVPAVQYAELAIGLANLVSGTNAVSDSARESIMQKTAAGDLKGALTYITGTPQNGTTQEVLKNLKDSIDRQGAVAEDLRNQAIQFLHGLAPTDLDPTRIAALEKNTLASYTNPTKDPNIAEENDALKSLQEYKNAHPEKILEIQKIIDEGKAILGREPTALEFLQAHPEYQ